MSSWKLTQPAMGLLLILALAACVPLEPPPPPTRMINTPAPATAVLPTETPPITTLQAPTAAASETPSAEVTGPATAIPNDIAQAAAAQTAQLLGVPESQVKVLGIERVEWPSPALGCPQPGLQYNTEKVLPGYSIRMEVNGLIYELHIADSGRSVLCNSNSEPVFPK